MDDLLDDFGSDLTTQSNVPSVEKYSQHTKPATTKTPVIPTPAPSISAPVHAPQGKTGQKVQQQQQQQQKLPQQHGGSSALNKIAGLAKKHTQVLNTSDAPISETSKPSLQEGVSPTKNDIEKQKPGKDDMDVDTSNTTFSNKEQKTKEKKTSSVARNLITAMDSVASQPQPQQKQKVEETIITATKASPSLHDLKKTPDDKKEPEKVSTAVSKKRKRDIVEEEEKEEKNVDTDMKTDDPVDQPVSKKKPPVKKTASKKKPRKPPTKKAKTDSDSAKKDSLSVDKDANKDETLSKKKKPLKNCNSLASLIHKMRKNENHKVLLGKDVCESMSDIAKYIAFQIVEQAQVITELHSNRVTVMQSDTATAIRQLLPEEISCHYNSTDFIPEFVKKRKGGKNGKKGEEAVKA